MDLTDILTILAIFIGPIAAVIISRKNDNRNHALERKFQIFRSLMKTRETQLHEEHVGALNLIQVEFYRQDKVIKHFQDYIKFRYSPVPTNDDGAQLHHNKEAEQLFYQMLQAIGTSINYDFEKDELKRFSYSPRGWHDNSALMHANSLLLNQVLQGHSTIPVSIES